MAESNQSGTNFAEHQKSYATFLWLTKWAMLIIAAILILMAIFLV